MSGKRGLYIAVLALSAGAFLVDRLFLGAPASAEAGPTAARPTVKALPPPGPPAAPAGSAMARLDALPPDGQVRDAFALSGTFLENVVKQQDALGTLQQQAADAASTFPSRHTLQTTLIGPETSLAVVDNQVLRLGDAFDGLTLVHVETGRAEFREPHSEVTAVLTLDPPPPTAP